MAATAAPAPAARAPRAAAPRCSAGGSGRSASAARPAVLAAGIDVSAFSVRCMRSCRPLSCGRGRRNVARLDAELQPPHRQSGEPAGSRRAERCPVVGSHGRRQADALENPLESASDTGPRGLDDARLDQEAAGLIGDRQRIATPSVSGAEPALEIDRPFLVGSASRRHHLALCDRTASLALRLHKAWRASGCRRSSRRPARWCRRPSGSSRPPTGP